MTLLGIDIGSSSIKAAILRGTRVVGAMKSATFATHFDGVRAEVEPTVLLKALSKAIAAVGPRAKSVDAIALSVMSPAWCAMDAKGKPLTPIVTHQDRRSIEIARAIEKRVGKSNHLRIAGNRPFPGSISSTTFAWFLQNESARMKRIDLAGNLNTFIHRQVTGERVIDPSNASFTGLYETTKQGGWSDELCDATGISARVLPRILEADRVAGTITAAAARRFHLRAGTPMLAGIIDTSAAMLLAKPMAGRVLNVAGSTDVLAVCMGNARPHEKLLTRALGVGNWWMSVSTIAAAGSTFTWCREQLFADLSNAAFWNRVAECAKDKREPVVRFEPYLAGERASIEQKSAAFTGLTLATSRRDLLHAAVDALARASAERLPLLAGRGQELDRRAIVSGGTSKGLGQVLYRDWPGQWTFRREDDATLRGLGTMTPRK